MILIQLNGNEFVSKRNMNFLSKESVSVSRGDLQVPNLCEECEYYAFQPWMMTMKHQTAWISRFGGTFLLGLFPGALRPIPDEFRRKFFVRKAGCAHLHHLQHQAQRLLRRCFDSDRSISSRLRDSRNLIAQRFSTTCWHQYDDILTFIDLLYNFLLHWTETIITKVVF